MQTRRSFIYNSSIAAAGSLFAPELLASDSAPGKKMGLQLFTIRDAMAKDPAATLTAISAIGYEDSETYGFDPASVSFYGLKAKDFLGLLEKNKLTTTSGHYDLFKYFNSSKEELLTYVDQCIIGAKILQQKYITWPWLDPADRKFENFQLLADKLNLVGERVTKAGLGFAYHNHDFEFVDYNGTTGYDIIMEKTDPKLVKLQVDLYWVCRASKRPPHELFQKQPGRFVMWHIKDMDKVSKDYSEMGNGSIDYTKILPDTVMSGMEYYYIEQGGNFRKSSMESAKESADFFQKNLRHLIK